MASEWFYFKGDQRNGPVDARQLKELAQSGALLSTDTVWKEGMATPVLATKVKGLFGHSERETMEYVDPLPSPTLSHVNSKRTRNIVIGVAALVGMFSCCGIAGVVGSFGNKGSKDGDAKESPASEPTKSNKTDYELGVEWGEKEAKNFIATYNSEKDLLKNDKKRWDVVQKTIINQIKAIDETLDKHYKDAVKYNSHHKPSVDSNKGKLDGFRKAIKKGIGISLS